MSTIYVRVAASWTEELVRSLFTEAYCDEPFVRLLPPGQLATIAHTAHTNMCTLSLTLARPGLLIVVSSIDNLVKGAAGQAVQCANLALGLPETDGLDLVPPGP